MASGGWIMQGETHEPWWLKESGCGACWLTGARTGSDWSLRLALMTAMELFCSISQTFVLWDPSASLGPELKYNRGQDIVNSLVENSVNRPRTLFLRLLVVDQNLTGLRASWLNKGEGTGWTAVLDEASLSQGEKIKIKSHNKENKVGVKLR